MEEYKDIENDVFDTFDAFDVFDASDIPNASTVTKKQKHKATN